MSALLSFCPLAAPDWGSDRVSLWNAVEGREALARDFVQALVDRYGSAADVAVQTRTGDQRNHHLHILTRNRDAAKTGGVKIKDMRGFWAQMQNRALERAGPSARAVWPHFGKCCNQMAGQP